MKQSEVNSLRFVIIVNDFTPVEENVVNIYFCGILIQKTLHLTKKECKNKIWPGFGKENRVLIKK